MAGKSKKRIRSEFFFEYLQPAKSYFFSTQQDTAWTFPRIKKPRATRTLQYQHTEAFYRFVEAYEWSMIIIFVFLVDLVFSFLGFNQNKTEAQGSKLGAQC